jgi:hypothetical protein
MAFVGYYHDPGVEKIRGEEVTIDFSNVIGPWDSRQKNAGMTIIIKNGNNRLWLSGGSVERHWSMGFPPKERGNDNNLKKRGNENNEKSLDF